MAPTGPIPIILGSTPTAAEFIIFALGFRLYFFTACSDAIINAAEPSLTPLAFPAVTVPFFLNGVGKEFSFSMLVSRGCSSPLKIISFFLN